MVHGRGETQVLGGEDADAAGGVYREQTTDERGAEQPVHSRSDEIPDWQLAQPLLICSILVETLKGGVFSAALPAPSSIASPSHSDLLLTSLQHCRLSA
jgi:hypothetical protein